MVYKYDIENSKIKADIWEEKRGKQRKLFSKIERLILEPICYIMGKL